MPNTLKMDIFFKGLNIIINTFCASFQGLSKAFHYLINFFALKFITYFENDLLKIPFSVIDLIV